MGDETYLLGMLHGENERVSSVGMVPGRKSSYLNCSYTITHTTKPNSHRERLQILPGSFASGTAARCVLSFLETAHILGSSRKYQTLFDGHVQVISPLGCEVFNPVPNRIPSPALSTDAP